MSFNLNYPSQNGNNSLTLDVGEILFVLGANGSGKSSLMVHYTHENQPNVRKIAAHRQTWINSDTLDLSPSIKVRLEENIQHQDLQQKSRYRDSYAAQRTSITFHRLVDAENIRARRITRLVDAGEGDKAEHEAANNKSPIAITNEILSQSNLPITISIHEDEQRIMASKQRGLTYNAAELSDGERNVLLIAGEVLTAPAGMLLIIDEPERHLHRSIISPLLSQLFKCRPDCGFVVSTHDHDLPMKMPNAKILLLRSYSAEAQNQSWVADELSNHMGIDDNFKRDLLGSRRNILFVEGNENSLDKELYNIIFPTTSVVPKGSCHNVEQAVTGLSATDDLHWLCVFGIVDGDGHTTDQIEIKHKKKIYTLPFYSVEAIYYHPEIISWVAKTNMQGKNYSDLVDKALEAASNKVGSNIKHLNKKAVKKLVRKMILGNIPNDDDLLLGKDICLKNNASEILKKHEIKLNELVEGLEWNEILKRVPVRESGALKAIADALGLANDNIYQESVLHILKTNNCALSFVRNLFGDLFDQLNNSKEAVDW